MPEVNTYTGGCHCGRVRYEATTNLAQVVRCNCSICTKRGAMWSFVKPEQFKLLKGEGEQTDYQFAKKVLHHLFCPSCGIGSFSTGQAPSGEKTYALNVRCLDGVNIETLKTTPFDGKRL